MHTRTFKACASLFRIRVAESFQYRMAALSGMITSFLWAIIEVAAFSVFFMYSEKAGLSGGLTLSQTISHIWVRELLLFMGSFNIDDDLLLKINNGDVGVELCRPLDLYWHWFARTSAGGIVKFVMRCLVCFALGFLVPGGYGAQLPVSIAGFAGFLLSALCAFILCASFGMLLHVIRMNVTWGNGPMYLIMLVANVLSGSYLPLQLWPDFMQNFLLFQPFAGLCDIPARLYIGSMEPSQMWLAVLVQLVWSVLLIVLGRRIMSQRTRNIIAQGG